MVVLAEGLYYMEQDMHACMYTSSKDCVLMHIELNLLRLKQAHFSHLKKKAIEISTSTVLFI